VTHLKAVPKPEGFDLRLKRAESQDSCRMWLPEDAIYDAYMQMKDENVVSAAVIAWYVKNPNGTLSLRYRISHEHDRQGVAIAADLLHEMQTGEVNHD
jgi:hypothetical protein